LLRRTSALTRRSRHTEASLLTHLAEIDARHLYLREACSSMYAYCTERLHFSEAEAFVRIAAARAARQHPVILEMLADGRLHLTAVALLAPHLTVANCAAVLGRAAHRSKREVRELVAGLSPRPDAPTLIRRLPRRVGSVTPAAALPGAAKPGVLGPCPAKVDRFDSPLSSERPPVLPPSPLPCRPVPHRTAELEPLAPGRFGGQFTAGAELVDNLERLQARMRSTAPDGDLATIIEEAVTRELARLERRKWARTQTPSKSLAQTTVKASSRCVPAAVRRAVHARDGGQCVYRDAEGRRCSARERLELHHRRPYGYGGDPSVGNLALLCQAHSRYLEEIDYGTRRGGPTWRQLRR